MGKYKAKYYKKLYKETLGELKSCKENQEYNRLTLLRKSGAFFTCD